MVPKVRFPWLSPLIMKFTSMKNTTPAQLKMRWIIAVRFAFLLEVIPAIIATIQEPMFEPKVRKMP